MMDFQETYDRVVAKVNSIFAPPCTIREGMASLDSTTNKDHPVLYVEGGSFGFTICLREDHKGDAVFWTPGNVNPMSGTLTIPEKVEKRVYHLLKYEIIRGFYSLTDFALSNNLKTWGKVTHIKDPLGTVYGAEYALLGDQWQDYRIILKMFRQGAGLDWTDANGQILDAHGIPVERFSLAEVALWLNDVTYRMAHP